MKEECLEMPGVRWVRGIRGSLYLWDPSTALTRELVVTGAFEVVDGERRDRGGGGGTQRWRWGVVVVVGEGNL